MSGLPELIEQHLFACSFKSMLGVECPGCGMQRAFVCLTRGEFMMSLRMNPSLLPFLFTIVYAISHLLLDLKQGARNIVIFFSVTVSVMVVNFVIKLIAGS